jgi:hypothetical protein
MLWIIDPLGSAYFNKNVFNPNIFQGYGQFGFNIDELTIKNQVAINTSDLPDIENKWGNWDFLS